MWHYRKTIAADLEQRRSQALYRKRLVSDAAVDPVVMVGGERLLAFNSNDYLGLANHPELKQAMINGVEKWGVGSGSAHLVTGHSRVHHELEQRLALFTGRQRALLFSSGYMANLGVLTSLVGKGDQIFQDKLNHASLIDGGLLSAAAMQRYLHKDVTSLQRKLSRSDSREQLIVTDGVFSMDGDVAPLTELAEVAQQHNALLMVDDAHGLGVLGDTGRGSLEACGVSNEQVPVLMGTLGKAIGTAGAFVAGDEDLIEYLIQKARSYIYTTAPPPAVAAATITSLDLLETESWRRQKLQTLIDYFVVQSGQLKLNFMASDTAIQPLVAGSSDTAIKWAQQLKNKGILVTAIRPPTVPEGTSRLRITLSANHTEQHVDQLIDALAGLKEDVE